jgi:hypothetical protein
MLTTPFCRGVSSINLSTVAGVERSEENYVERSRYQQYTADDLNALGRSSVLSGPVAEHIRSRFAVGWLRRSGGFIIFDERKFVKIPRLGRMVG